MRICVILYGRQKLKAYKNILKIINYLKSDIFLIYDNDICNYSKHSKLINKLCVKNINEEHKVDNQFLKIKLGWNLMKQYENKKKFKYDYVFRLRCDILYKLNKHIDITLIKKNKVYLNSDFLFYGLRKEVKNCFLLYDLWYELKNNTKKLYNINLSNLIKTIKNNPDECFNLKKWKYCNKIKAIPLPILKNTSNNNFNKKHTLKILYNLNKIYANYEDVLKNKDYELNFFNKNDKIRKFPCELSILLVLLSNNIIPCQSKFIEVIKKVY